MKKLKVLLAVVLVAPLLFTGCGEKKEKEGISFHFSPLTGKLSISVNVDTKKD